MLSESWILPSSTWADHYAHKTETSATCYALNSDTELGGELNF